MRVVFKLDRVGHGVESTFGSEFVIEDADFVPGIDDVIKLPSDGKLRVPRLVYKRLFEVTADGGLVVTIYADEALALMHRRNKERLEQRSAADLWKVST